MRRKPIDDETAARLLRGAVDPADAPPGYAGVAALMQQAGGAGGELDPERRAATVDAMAAAVTEPSATPKIPRRSTVFSKLSPKLAAAAAAGAFSVAGVAAAATGSLPPPLKGLEAAFHSDARVVADESEPSTTGPRNHGACVSMVARDHRGGFATDGTGGFATDGTDRDDNHGQRVRDAAHSDCGKKDHDERDGEADDRRGRRSDDDKATTSTIVRRTTTTTVRPTTTTRPAGSTTTTDDNRGRGRGGDDNHGSDDHRGQGHGSDDHRGDDNHGGGNSGHGGGDD